MVYSELGTGRLVVFIGGEMFRCSASKGKSLNLRWPRYDPGPLAYVHGLGLAVDRYCDVFAVSAEGHALNAKIRTTTQIEWIAQIPKNSANQCSGQSLGTLMFSQDSQKAGNAD